MHTTLLTLPNSILLSLLLLTVRSSNLHAVHCSYLVVLEGEYFRGNASLSDDLDLDAVSSVDVALGGDHEDVLHDGHHLLGRELLLLVQPVLVANLQV